MLWDEILTPKRSISLQGSHYYYYYDYYYYYYYYYSYYYCYYSCRSPRVCRASAAARSDARRAGEETGKDLSVACWPSRGLNAVSGPAPCSCSAAVSPRLPRRIDIVRCSHAR